MFKYLKSIIYLAFFMVGLVGTQLYLSNDSKAETKRENKKVSKAANSKHEAERLYNLYKVQNRFLSVKYPDSRANPIKYKKD
jgi:hypothetical protein